MPVADNCSAMLIKIYALEGNPIVIHPATFSARYVEVDEPIKAGSGAMKTGEIPD